MDRRDVSVSIIEIPQDILNPARMTVPEIKRELAIHLYAQGRLSIGKARALAEMSLWQFRHYLAAREIPVHYDVADLEDEMVTLQKLERV
jgi:predicted HTH domain antitoxin